MYQRRSMIIFRHQVSKRRSEQFSTRLDHTYLRISRLNLKAFQVDTADAIPFPNDEIYTPITSTQ
ncbi:hypothetical protein PZA11_002517 [Diplocarpon coronariae]